MEKSFSHSEMNRMALRITGCITALATPFEADGELDTDAWRRLLDRQLDGGVEGLVVAGSTGEAASLLEPEYDAILRLAVERVAGRVPVLAGTGLSNTQKTIELTRRVRALGADAALVVTPPYVRPTTDGLIAHYRAIADDNALPIVLYNVPSRTGVDMDIAAVEALHSHPNIIGIKEARSDSARMSALLRLRSPNFAILSGDDPTAGRAMLAGADGLISVGSNVAPRSFRRLCDLSRARRSGDSQALDQAMADLYDFLGIEPNPIPVKALLHQQGIGYGLRLPLTSLSPEYANTMRQVAEQVELLESQALRAGSI